MKTNLKKLVAVASVLGLVVMNALSVNGANISSITVNGGTTLAATTEVTTVAFDPITALTAGSTIRVYYPATITDTGLVAGDIDVTNASTDLTEGAITVDTANNMITIPVTAVTTGGDIVTLNFTGTHFTGPASGNVRFAVTTSVGDTGSQLVYVANSNQVNVTAVVQPILKMDLSTTSLNLGVLPTAANTYATQGVTVTTATNAQGGLVVAMGSTGLKDTTINREIGVTDIAGPTTNTTATDYYKISTNATPTIVDANDALANVGGTDVLATQNVYSNAIPHNDTVTTVTIGARADTTTEAGNYSDTLTFTVTGTF